MIRITYSRELLLSYNTPACQRTPVTAAIPEALRISKHPKVATLFNQGSACRPTESQHSNHDLDPSSGGGGVACTC